MRQTQITLIALLLLVAGMSGMALQSNPITKPVKDVSANGPIIQVEPVIRRSMTPPDNVPSGLTQSFAYTIHAYDFIPIQSDMTYDSLRMATVIAPVEQRSGLIGH